MASNTMASWHKRVRKHKNQGRKRKNAESLHSTPSAVNLFAGMGEPGQPAQRLGAAPKAAPKAAAPKAAKSAKK